MRTNIILDTNTYLRLTLIVPAIALIGITGCSTADPIVKELQSWIERTVLNFNRSLLSQASYIRHGIIHVNLQFDCHPCASVFILGRV